MKLMPENDRMNNLKMLVNLGESEDVSLAIAIVWH